MSNLPSWLQPGARELEELRAALGTAHCRAEEQEEQARKWRQEAGERYQEYTSAMERLESAEEHARSLLHNADEEIACLTRERDKARAERGAWKSAANTWEATATVLEARLSAQARVVEAARDALARIESDIESPGRTTAEGDALRQALSGDGTCGA